MKCGLLGEKLGHSYSPKIHGLLGAYDYRLIELEPDALRAFFEKRDFDGLNVTIPYKKAVLPLCDALTERAKTIGSVNTVVHCADGTLLGDNTDFFGFCYLLRSSGIDPRGKKTLVLGSGGASLTVQAALRELGAAQVTVVSREGENNYVNLYERQPDAQLLVNATPVGMALRTGESLVALSMLPRLEAVVDLIYNPAKTKLLLDAEALGLKAVNGLGMLTALGGRGWLVVILLGIALALGGMLCILRPSMVMGILSAIFGIIIAVDGAITFIDAIDCARAKIKEWRILMLISFASMALGAVIMFVESSAIMVLAGIFLIIEGVIDIVIISLFGKQIKKAKRIVAQAVKVEDADEPAAPAAVAVEAAAVETAEAATAKTDEEIENEIGRLGQE